MAALDFLLDDLGDLASLGLLRASGLALQRPELPELEDAASNDYLGFGAEPVSRATLLACEGLPLSATASRLIHGNWKAHTELESSLAEWVGLPAALLFSSGYAANVGTLAALIQPQDIVISDALNHASLIDGLRLARAQVKITPHLDLKAVTAALAARQPSTRAWLVVESYYSMDGDSPDLAALRALCDRDGAALIVDEAHALGVFGPTGAGLCRAAGVEPDVLIGTLGKAVGAQGAFVAGSAVLREWLWNRARSFVFSTAPSPLLSNLCSAAVTRVRAADSRRQRLDELSRRARSLLVERRVDVAPSHGPILPILLDGNDRALAAAAHLAAAGFRAQAIRPPTVPEGSTRVRATLHASWSDAALERFVQALTTLP